MSSQKPSQIRPVSSINFGSQLKQLPTSSSMIKNLIVPAKKYMKQSQTIQSARLHNYSYHENLTKKSNLTVLKKNLFPQKAKIEKEKLTDENIQAKIKYQKIYSENNMLQNKLEEIEVFFIHLVIKPKIKSTYLRGGKLSFQSI